ncbi:MAG: VWA domain-containing protein [Gammaproteobacteria bacterium]|nr:VWA domain-containing protein [Gammaproteobacteria bacterium]
MSAVRRRRQVEVFSMSFLDVVCCGFGAIILLFVLSKQAEPTVIEGIREDLEGVVAELEQTIHEIRGDTTVLRRELDSARAALADDRTALARLDAELAATRARVADAEHTAEARAVIEAALADARQELSEEMRRLLGEDHRRAASDNVIAGIPVDSEYVIFIIDTSGSMRDNAWALVQRKLAETLDIYPAVKGIQVMNDQGHYMFSQYAGQWIPDTPARREVILRRLRTWSATSASSPVDGITRAIRTFYAPDRKISLYVFGDEFAQGSLESVVRTVDRINEEDADGNRLVRIHGVGFPTQLARPPGARNTGDDFATLMRILCERNGGSFVGLNRFRP